MELNLRKARKLESKIQTYLEENYLETKTDVRTLGSTEEAEEIVDGVVPKDEITSGNSIEVSIQIQSIMQDFAGIDRQLIVAIDQGVRCWIYRLAS